MNIENFLTQEEEQEIVQAIQIAERNTSGEIRVHLEAKTDKNPLERAIEVFGLLKMQETQQRNGVLFYFAVESHLFAIYADKGINEVVPDNFWDSIRDEMKINFQKGDFKSGIIAGILKTGEELKTHFPYDEVSDVNELSDELSKGNI